jgi:hypothetical protein
MMEERGDAQASAWYQQGDVLITPAAEIPESAVRVGTRVLREGEATGHAHVATADDVQLFLHEGTLYMRAPTGTEVVHEEHRAFRVPPGTYRIGAVREYDHFAEEARSVLD